MMTTDLLEETKALLLNRHFAWSNGTQVHETSDLERYYEELEGRDPFQTRMAIAGLEKAGRVKKFKDYASRVFWFSDPRFRKPAEFELAESIDLQVGDKYLSFQRGQRYNFYLTDQYHMRALNPNFLFSIESTDLIILHDVWAYLSEEGLRLQFHYLQSKKDHHYYSKSTGTWYYQGPHRLVLTRGKVL